MRILVIEDDKRISDFLIKGLEENGHFATFCKSAEEALSIYKSSSWDIIICDVMLPQMNGIQLVQALRYKGVTTPILMLSALNEVEDKVHALDSGADDYITKPFHFSELISRINALTRRLNKSHAGEEGTILSFFSLTIDINKHEVCLKDQVVNLSPKEYKLLLYLVENKNKALSRAQLLNTIWGINFDNHTNVVDVYISYLRTKLEQENKFIYTVKGVGYMFKTEN